MVRGSPHPPYGTVSVIKILAATALLCAIPSSLFGFVPVNRWTSTATDGLTGNNGDPVTLTWGLTPDGTSIIGETDSSNLVSFLDGIYGTAPGLISNRPWFSLVEMSFNRWSELSGITFQYEPEDDRAAQGVGAPGGLAVRPDIRIGGVSIDGNSGTLAYANFPNGGDIVFDTSDGFYNNTTSNSLRIRNVLMHEVGHSIGLGHIESNNANFLLEPSISTTFDGPQYDDIRGIQHLYGDALEKTNNGAGNGTSALATDLGSLTAGQTRSIGTDTGSGTLVLPSETDFVSIANQSDIDFYSFQIDEPSVIDLTLTPVGATFNQVVQGGSEQTEFVTSQISNLSLTLIDSNGSVVLSSANANPAGIAETILGFELATPGEYFVRITGGDNAVQFYELDLRASAIAPVLLGDYNGDQVVDAADYTLWRDTLGQTGTNLAADGNGDNLIDAADYDIWKLNFGNVLETPSAAVVVANVPEPGTLLVALLGFLSLVWLGKKSGPPRAQEQACF